MWFSATVSREESGALKFASPKKEVGNVSAAQGVQEGTELFLPQTPLDI